MTTRRTGRQQNSLALKAYMEGIHVGFDRRICTDASSKPLPIATYCLRLAQIRRAKLRCTCHGAIFERVLVRRTQEYKSIPRTTSRKSPEIAHVRRHGSLPCMPLFSPREPLFRRRCAPLKVSLWRRMSADATGIFILTGEQTPSLRRTLARAFSPPLAPTFGERREDNNLTSQEARSVVFSP